MDFKFTKEISEKYTIRLPKMNGWAIIFLDEKTGTLAIHSDFGNWAYHWSDTGCESFKRFLTECDTDYVSRKFVGSKRWVNIEETIKAIKADIIKKRRNNYCTKEEARYSVDELKNMLSGMGQATVNDFMNEIMLECYYLDRLYHHQLEDIPVRTEYENGVNCFMKNIWPVFVEILKTEMSKELVGNAKESS